MLENKFDIYKSRTWAIRSKKCCIGHENFSSDDESILFLFRSEYFWSLHSFPRAAIFAVRNDLFTDRIEATTGIDFTEIRKVNDVRTISLHAIGVRIIAILATLS